LIGPLRIEELLLSLFDETSSALKDAGLAEANAGGIDSLLFDGLTYATLTGPFSREDKPHPGSDLITPESAEANAAGNGIFGTEGVSMIGPFSTEEALPPLLDDSTSVGGGAAKAAGIRTFLMGLTGGTMDFSTGPFSPEESNSGITSPFLLRFTVTDRVFSIVSLSNVDSLPPFLDKSVFVAPAFGLDTTNAAGMAIFFTAFVLISGVSLTDC
jgi:hypothetical protein